MPKEGSDTKHDKLYRLWYDKIVSGEWKAGQKIEPERELCDKYSVSRSTVRETLRLLEQKGLISRTQGKGTFVNVRRVEQKLTKLYTLREQFERLNIPHYSKMLDFSILEANYIEAQNLNIERGDKIIKITRLFYASKTPYTLEISYLPERFFPGMTAQQVQDNGLYKSFALHHVTVQRAIEKLKPANLDKTASKLLLTTEVAMKIERTSYWDQEVIEFTESYVRGDFFEYTVYLGE